MNTTPVQLIIRFGAPPPVISFLEQIASDGTRAPFILPKGKAFVLTDITIFGLVAGTVAVGIAQGPASNPRWEYMASSIDRNFERTFATGLVFTTPFQVIGATLPGQVLTVFLSGFLRKR
jgi:hypothetical protein